MLSDWPGEIKGTLRDYKKLQTTACQRAMATLRENVGVTFSENWGYPCTLWAYDPCLSAAGVESLGAKAVPLNRLLAEADFVSLHAPLTKETRNLIDMAALRRMKATAYLINTARGELVDEEALYEGLTQNLIAGAALDVFTKEPPIGNPLLKLPNVVATPHMGAHSLEAITNVSIFAARSIVQAFQTGEPLHRVI